MVTLPDEVYASARRPDLMHREVADVLGVHPKLLQRVLQKLRDKMEKP